jgi:hypothetical protein
MAAKLTPKQEAFAYAVGYEGKKYSRAYREIYDVKPETLDRSVWVRASELANNSKVSVRIDELKKQKLEEGRRAFSWDISETEAELRFLIGKNKKDLVVAERNNKPAKHANNVALANAVQQLTDLYFKLQEVEIDTARVNNGQPQVQIIKREPKKYEPDSL